MQDNTEVQHHTPSKHTSSQPNTNNTHLPNTPNKHSQYCHTTESLRTSQSTATLDSGGASHGFKWELPEKLFPGQHVTIGNTKQALHLPNTDILGRPRCIIVHTGMNDKQGVPRFPHCHLHPAATHRLPTPRHPRGQCRLNQEL